MIEARGLSKRFQDKKRGEIRAVDNVSFTCQPGKIYGLLGANGAGKTTTLRMLATILEPTDGTAIVCGHDVVEQPKKSAKTSVSFPLPRPSIAGSPPKNLWNISAASMA